MLSSMPKELVLSGIEDIPSAPGISYLNTRFYFGVVSAENMEVEIKFILAAPWKLTQAVDTYTAKVQIVPSNSSEFVAYSENTVSQTPFFAGSEAVNTNDKYGYVCQTADLSKETRAYGVVCNSRDAAQICGNACSVQNNTVKYGYPCGAQDAMAKCSSPCGVQDTVVKYGYPCGVQDAMMKYGYACLAMAYGYPPINPGICVKYGYPGCC